MGVLTDYFRAADAAAVVRGMEHAEAGPVVGEGAPFAGVEGKWVDPDVVFGQLVAIIRGVPWHPRLVESRPVWPDVPEEAEAWVFELDDAARDSVAGVPESAVDEVAQAWARTDELAGLSVEHLRELVGELAELAREARDRGERLYCWCSL